MQRQLPVKTIAQINSMQSFSSAAFSANIESHSPAMAQNSSTKKTKQPLQAHTPQGKTRNALLFFVRRRKE
jgi:hypothetical protein